MPGFVPTLIPPITPPPIQPTNFVPKRREIDTITPGFPTVITTTEDHGYDSTIIVSFLIPNMTKMQKLQGQYFPITVLSADSFSIQADTSTDVFVIQQDQVAQVFPSAEKNLTLRNATNNDLNQR